MLIVSKLDEGSFANEGHNLLGVWNYMTLLKIHWFEFLGSKNSKFKLTSFDNAPKTEWEFFSVNQRDIKSATMNMNLSLHPQPKHSINKLTWFKIQMRNEKLKMIFKLRHFSIVSNFFFHSQESINQIQLLTYIHYILYIIFKSPTLFDLLLLLFLLFIVL